MASVAGILLCVTCCGGDINSVSDPHFDAEGHLLPQYSGKQSFAPKAPSRVKFYVEVSGSMNGFLRANFPTAFKTDLWDIMSYYSALAPKVGILTNDGTSGAELDQATFRTAMNAGAFVSSASTKVPLMLATIISDLDADKGEVAVLVSDMKYSPVGAASPEVLLTQYSTDVSTLLGRFGKAASLVCATSDYINTQGQDVAAGRSPYYYLILGAAPQVAEMRNGISALLSMHNHFVDNIESGFDYGRAPHTFGISTGCVQMDGAPTFVGYDTDADTCCVKLKVDLANFRWLLSDKQAFLQAFRVKALYGSEVSVRDVQIETHNTVDRELKREAVATVSLRLSHMALDSEVLEWNIDLPDTDTRLFAPFFENATSEDDPMKSFSVPGFIKGLFCGGVVNKPLLPNYILISKND